ncbi:protein GAMETE EXPRESSED 3 [Euphorbia lathyris]|uniref:protein GAMETE EXPRESSED 3 n=1 Tax=Euphorbia lathyris TaxID=212925 RepID=UPI0033139A3F
MSIILLLFFPLITSLSYADFQKFPGKQTSTQTKFRLSKPLIGDDGRIYFCSDRNVVAFETNGSIAWTLRLPFTCNVAIAPVFAGRGKIYLIAENRILDINYINYGPSSPSSPSSQVLFGPENGHNGAGEIIGFAVSTLSSSLYINIKNHGLFAFTTSAKLLWSVGPVLVQAGYSLGCSKDIKDCYFTSVPVIDLCEASLYISNTAGELYSLSLASPHFNWVKDLSSLDKDFGITPGNNGLLYVTVSSKAIILALHVSKGTVIWQTSVGPLSRAECRPAVDSNGWVSIGSLDGFVYSISPTGEVKKFLKASQENHVIQVSPFVDCSGYAIYISQAEMEGKISLKIGEYNYVSAMRPKGAVFTLFVPETGAIYWSESYPDQLLSSLSKSDLQHFVLDEGILIAFIAASRTGNPLPCRRKYEKLVSSCSQARPKHLKIHTGNEKTIILFLLFESLVLIIIAGLVRFCWIFWSKKKLKKLELGKFLEKRRSLQLKKKAFDHTITELEEKAAEEAVGNEVIEELRDLVRERQGIERKLSTSYSLGRDQIGLKSNSLLPVYDRSSRSYSFQSGKPVYDRSSRSYSSQSGKKEQYSTILNTLSDASSSEENTSEGGSSSWSLEQEHEEEDTSDDERNYVKQVESSPEAAAASSSGLNLIPLSVESTQTSGRNTWLKRRTFSSTY